MAEAADAYTFTPENAKCAAVDDFVSQVFDDYCREKLGAVENFFEWGFEAVTDSGRTVGVVFGEAYVGGLIINDLVVASDLRHQGLGSYLLGLALRLGRDRGQGVARLTAFEYQAPTFFQRHGFAVDISRDCFSPTAGSLHYLSRTLSVTDPDALSGASLPESFVIRGGAPLLSIRAMPEGGHAACAAAASALFRGPGSDLGVCTATELTRPEPFCFVARRSHADGRIMQSPEDDADGLVHSPGTNDIVGTVYGHTIWGFAEVEILAVDPALRRSGLGARLLARAEAHARSSGAKIVCLQTFDFQVRRAAGADACHESAWLELNAFVVPAVWLRLPQVAAAWHAQTPACIKLVLLCWCASLSASVSTTLSAERASSH